MAFYFDKKFAVGNSGLHHKTQADHVTHVRNSFSGDNARHVMANMGASRFQGNAAAVIPRDVYQEFDMVPAELMRAPVSTIMGDLMGIAKSLPLGKVEHIYREVSDSGVVISDVDMSTPAELDKSVYDYASAIKVFHKTGFGRGWMEVEAQGTEGFDGLIDDQKNATRKIIDKIASHIIDGVDKTFNGTAAVGIKNSTRTIDVDLDASGLNVDLTSSATTAAAIRNAFISLRDTLQITNNVPDEITFYISATIASNLERFYGTEAGDMGKTILMSIKELAGVADVKIDRTLSGNEVIGMAVSDKFIRPLVGMSVSTVPLFRANQFDNYNFMTWANVGLEIKTDYTGKAGVLYARNIA